MHLLAPITWMPSAHQVFSVTRWNQFTSESSNCLLVRMAICFLFWLSPRLVQCCPKNCSCLSSFRGRKFPDICGAYLFPSVLLSGRGTGELQEGCRFLKKGSNVSFQRAADSLKVNLMNGWFTKFNWLLQLLILFEWIKYFQREYYLDELREYSYMFTITNEYILKDYYKESVQFSCSVVSNSLWPHGLQHARLPCPSPTPRVHTSWLIF